MSKHEPSTLASRIEAEAAAGNCRCENRMTSASECWKCLRAELLKKLGGAK